MLPTVEGPPSVRARQRCKARVTIEPEIIAAVRKIINGIYVVSTVSGGEHNAMTAAWVQRASFEPPLLTAAVGTGRYTHDMIKASGVFAVHALGAGQERIARHFGLKSGRKTDKFKGVKFGTAVTGSPILKDCIAWFDCRVYGEHEAGDHTLFIGEILDARVLSDEPTIVYDKEKFYGR